MIRQYRPFAPLRSRVPCLYVQWPPQPRDFRLWGLAFAMLLVPLGGWDPVQRTFPALRCYFDWQRGASLPHVSWSLTK